MCVSHAAHGRLCETLIFPRPGSSQLASISIAARQSGVLCDQDWMSSANAARGNILNSTSRGRAMFFACGQLDLQLTWNLTPTRCRFGQLMFSVQSSYYT
mmetsp:Transcript_15365/g.42081  ORF Transcript_15365/g.42081 Transcript_15365/m.42081 type:complete len:100 (-) Transcript_15365:129-428(-)